MKTTIEKVETSLQINEALALHEKGWVVQRIGWVCVFAIVAAGALGVFGDGILSKGVLQAGNIKIEYQKLYRYETEMKICIKAPTEHISTVAFPQQYLSDFSKIEFIPKPQMNSTANGWIYYQFAPKDNHIVTVYVTPRVSGAINGAVAINQSGVQPLHHFIFP